jgi:hypothetical protein
MNSEISRRQLLQMGLYGTGALALSSLGLPQRAWAQGEEPHFFLQLFFDGGMDSSYLFDARPLEMTKNGKIQNYLGVEPKVWTGANGVSTFVTDIVKPLETFQNDFSILNGVMIAPTFDGHPQNINQLFTGNVFGGSSFIPHLNVKSAQRSTCPIDALQSGFLQLDADNLGNQIPLDLPSFQIMQSRIQRAPPIDTQNPVMSFIRQRMEALGKGAGSFSQGASQMMSAHQKSAQLSQQLLNVPELIKAPGDEVLEFLSLVLGSFKAGVVRSALISPSFNLIGSLDAHDSVTAKNQPKNLERVVEVISKVLKALKGTPYDSNRSFFDLTTLYVTSDFGRTMKSNKNSSVDDTGTNHNPFSATQLLAGKGIRGGLVIGESDFKSSTESLSKAHLSMDKDLLYTMGRPFDYSTLKSKDLKPEVFDPSQYLAVDSVVNSIYTLFGGPRERMRSLGRNGPPAPVLQGLLS